VGVVSHSGGENLFAAMTKTKLVSEIAQEFCREWWGDLVKEFGDKVPAKAPQDDRECVDAYFGAHMNHGEVEESWSDKRIEVIGTAKLLKAINAVLDNADDTGCDGDLTVTSKSAVDELVDANKEIEIK
jgi:hypothetical protein